MLHISSYNIPIRIRKKLNKSCIVIHSNTVCNKIKYFFFNKIREKKTQNKQKIKIQWSPLNIPEMGSRLSKKFCLLFYCKPNLLHPESMSKISFGQDQKECNNVAGSVAQRRQVGSKSGNILFSLVLDNGLCALP